MSPLAETVKTPLDFALDLCTDDKVKRRVLETTHALVSTCLTQAMLRTDGKTAEMIAAEAKAYASQIHELEKHLGAGYSAVTPQSAAKTVYTTMRQIPPNTQPAT